MFSEGLTTALTAAPAEGVVPPALLVGVWETVLGEIAGRFEDVWVGEFSRMAMDSPYFSLEVNKVR